MSPAKHAFSQVNPSFHAPTRHHSCGTPAQVPRPLCAESSGDAEVEYPFTCGIAVQGSRIRATARYTSGGVPPGQSGPAAPGGSTPGNAAVRPHAEPAGRRLGRRRIPGAGQHRHHAAERRDGNARPLGAVAVHRLDVTRAVSMSAISAAAGVPLGDALPGRLVERDHPAWQGDHGPAESDAAARGRSSGDVGRAEHSLKDLSQPRPIVVVEDDR